MGKDDIKKLEETAKKIRRSIVETLSSAKAGHMGGSLSVTDILTVLYFKEMKIDPSRPDWEDRDRFVLSKGHASCGLYCALVERGYFAKDLLSTFDRTDGCLQGHPDMHKTPGVDMSTGSLGQGLSVGAGMAAGARLLKKSFRVFVVLGDGEVQEGQVWEAAMYAGHNKLDNLTAIIDYNKLQLASRVQDAIDLEPLADKFRAFKWNVIGADGHSIESLCKAFEKARKNKGRPSVIIADTVKGKGISFAENKVEWHVRVPKGDEIAKALDELK
ncbi:transketolase [Candidatus Desantisbacteria bacterium CG_4_9_14_3_um_filter_50_7]|nr:MAG: transketolase [Candidatus Desantisbacteria bacterium CG_4_9_14_3_um_filter_50_7]